MANHHVPNLDAIQKLDDQAIQFYANVGAVMSLSSALELTSVDIFQQATNIDRDLAIKLLFQVRNTSLRRDHADLAMRHRLEADAAHLAEWDDLSKRIVAATTKNFDYVVSLVY